MSEREKRLEIVRQYLLDVEGHPQELIESESAVHYIRWNFHRAVEYSMVDEDLLRRLSRIARPPVEEEFQAQIEGPVAELMVGRMQKIVATPAAFGLWFRRDVLGPIIAEENRILEHSSTKLIACLHRCRTYCDRIGDVFRFKAWEIAGFPSAQNVPPRVEPAAEEAS